MQNEETAALAEEKSLQYANRTQALPSHLCPDLQ